MKDYKIYSMKYLKEKELTENDLYYLFDTPSLNYSLVVNMFKFAGKKMKPDDILNICKTNERWVYEYHWTKEQHDQWINEVADVYKNIYQYGPEEAEHGAQWWVFQYGMSVEGENLLTE